MNSQYINLNNEDLLERNPELLQMRNRKLAYRTKREQSRKQLSDDGFDSQLERDWFEELRARGYAPIAHPFTLHLPGGVDYTPDALIQVPVFTVYEVKGEHVKNTRDSYTRFRIAAGLYLCWPWVWVRRDKSGRWIEKTL